MSLKRASSFWAAVVWLMGSLAHADLASAAEGEPRVSDGSGAGEGDRPVTGAGAAVTTDAAHDETTPTSRLESPSDEDAMDPLPEEPAFVRPPLAWYASEFIAGVGFATAQVTLVWAFVERDEPRTRDRLLIISAISAGTALVALGTAGVIWSSAASKHAHATAYVGAGSIGVRGTF